MPPVLLNHRRTVSGVLPADGPDPDYIQPTSDFGDTHVLGGAAADRQAMLSKASEADKAIWDWLAYSDASQTLTNATGAGLVQGDVVVFTNPASVGLDDTLSSQNHFAVCAEATLANAVAGRFWAANIIPVVKNKGSVTALHYLRKSATTKAVETTGVAAGPSVQVPSGALGLALSTVVGDGTVIALWFTRPAPLLPPLTAGYVKGTGTGYATQAVPIPIADFTTGTPTGEKFVRDDGVLAVPPGTAGADPILDRVTSPVTVANTTTETNLYAFNTLANKLSTNKRLRLRLLCTVTDTNAAVSGRSLTIRAKYGATTLATVVLGTAIVDSACPPGVVTIGGPAALGITFELANLGVTNAQQGHLVLESPSLITFAGAILSHLPLPVQGTSATDSTADRTLAVTAQWNVANAANTMTMKYGGLELL